MKIPDLTVKLIVDTTRLETLMEELTSFHYAPFVETPEIAKGFDDAVHHWMKMGWDSMAPWVDKAPGTHSYLSLSRKTISADALQALLEIGGCVLTGDENVEGIHLRLQKKTYHQFNPNGIIFSTEGRAFDPSYGGLKLSPVRFLLKKYTSAQYGGGLIDKMVSQRDEHWVLFPPNTDEVEGEGNLMVYTLPGEKDKELVIDAHGYLYQRNKKRPFKKGDKVYVTLQGAILHGTYDTNQPVQEDYPELAYVDFDEEEREYILINAKHVFHAQ